MNDVLPNVREEPGLPVSGVAVLAGVLAAYGAFAVLISIVAAFANGAHSHQVLSGATWKQLGTGGGIVAGIVLFVAWAAGGFVAARMARRDGVRHGVWVFIIGVVFITVVGAAITWLPDTTAILRNLRLLGMPLRRNEWRDVGTVAGIASLVGMAVGAPVGGWLALRERAVAPAGERPAAPSTVPAPTPPAEPEKKEPVPEPAFVGPSLFEQTRPPDPAGEPDEQQAEPAAEEVPAWQQFVQERQRGISEPEREPARNEEFVAPAPAPSPSTPSAPWADAEPAPTFIEEPEQDEPEPAEVSSWWPDQGEPAVQPSLSYDEAWALPDDESAQTGAEAPEGAAFPHPPPTPAPEPVPVSDAVVVAPLDEHEDWREDEEPYRAPPEPAADEAMQQAPEAPPPPPEADLEEREERRRQQEEAARAYEQARERDQ